MDSAHINNTVMISCRYTAQPLRTHTHTLPWYGIYRVILHFEICVVTASQYMVMTWINWTLTTTCTPTACTHIQAWNMPISGSHWLASRPWPRPLWERQKKIQPLFLLFVQIGNYMPHKKPHLALDELQRSIWQKSLVIMAFLRLPNDMRHEIRAECVSWASSFTSFALAQLSSKVTSYISCGSL